ncbi:MAG: DsrE family protein [Chloroflexi bacterium]|nr:DsrE family protein [Chloroflexota bacterium]
MGHLLVHIATGPENPTRLALGLRVARMALVAGHEASVFLAGDAVHALRPETRRAIEGIGTGPAQEHWDALLAGGAAIYASALSSAARGITEPPYGVRLVAPERLVELLFEVDRSVSY